MITINRAYLLKIVGKKKLWVTILYTCNLYSVKFSRSVLSDSLRPYGSHGLQHARPPCPSPTPRVYSSSCPLSQWCHPTISSSVVPFSSCLQSSPASGSFQVSLFFASGGQSIGVSASASVLWLNIPDWYPLGWTGWISLQFKGLSRVFSNVEYISYSSKNKNHRKCKGIPFPRSLSWLGRKDVKAGGW